MPYGRNSLITLVAACSAAFAISPAQAATVDCRQVANVQNAPSTPDSDDVISATAAVVSGRDDSFVIWRAGRQQWESGLGGSLLAPGDAICARTTSRVFVRQAVNGKVATVSSPEGGDPLIVPGSRGMAPTAAALRFVAGLDWPSASESAAIERAMLRAVSGRAPRQRSGATRGMSVGSTPRAVYLDPVTSLEGVTTQTLARGMKHYLWGWCGQSVEGVFKGKGGTSGPLDPFVPVAGSDFSDVATIRLLSPENTREFAVEWVDSKDLPRPDWLDRKGDPLLHALWLVEEGGGRYQAQGYGMLHAIAHERPAALHYLAYLSNCGGGPTYAPELEPIE